MQEKLSGGKGPVPGSFEMPPAFYQVLIGVLVFLTRYTSHTRYTYWIRHLEKLQTKFSKAESELFGQFVYASLSEQEAVSSASLVGLLLHRVCDLIPPYSDPNLVYGAYTQRLGQLVRIPPRYLFVDGN